MRLLVSGLVLLALSISVSEYVTRTRKPVGNKMDSLSKAPLPVEPKKNQPPKLPPEVASLLTISASNDVPIQKPKDSFLSLLTANQESPPTFKGVGAGRFSARQLSGGFGWAVFLADAQNETAIVRVSENEKPDIVLVWPWHIDELWVDGSTLFFSSQNAIYSKPARGDESVHLVARFSQGAIVHFAVASDGVVVALTDAAKKTNTVIARVDADKNVIPLATDVPKVDALVSDAKEVFWLAKGDLFHAPLDGTFSSRLAEGVNAPISLEAKSLVTNSKTGMQRIMRDSGETEHLNEATPNVLSSSAGTVRYPEGPILFELRREAQAIPLGTFKDSISGVAIGGTTLFVLTNNAQSSFIHAK
jgi:hypothetical protein